MRFDKGKKVELSDKSKQWLLGKNGSLARLVLAALGYSATIVLLILLSHYAWGYGLWAGLWTVEGLLETLVFLLCVTVIAAGVVHYLLTHYREKEGGFDLGGIVRRRAPLVPPPYLPGEQAKMKSRLLLTSAPQPGNAAASFFMTAAICPQNVITVLEEKVGPRTRSLWVESTCSFLVPSTVLSRCFVLPVLVQRRGTYPESFTVTNVVGATGEGMNLQEASHYVKSVVDLYCPWIKKDPKLFSRVERYLGCTKEIDEGESQSRRDEVAGLARDIKEGTSDSKEALRAEVVSQFLQLMADSYLICARFNPVSASTDKLITVRCEYRVPLVRTERWEFEEGLVKGLFGFVIKRPMTFYYGLQGADRAQSYHLQVEGPPGNYFSLAALRKKEKEPSPLPSAEIAVAKRRRGQRHAQLCIQNGIGFSNWSFMFRCAPRYFSLYHLTLVVLILGSVMIWMYLSALAGLDPSLKAEGGGTAVSVVVAISAALITIASSWVVRTNENGRESEFVPCALGFISIVASLLVLISLYVPAGNCGVFQHRCSVFLLVMCFFLLAASIPGMLVSVFTSWRLYSGYKKEGRSEDDLICNDSSALPSAASVGDRWSAGWSAYDPILGREVSLIRKVELLMRIDKNYVRDCLVL